MQVLKFGGTSVGSTENMISVRHIIDTPTPKIVVLSAMSGTTNALVQIANAAKASNLTEASELRSILQSRYDDVVEQLITDKRLKPLVIGYVDEIFAEIERLSSEDFSDQKAEAIVAQGELLSTFIFCHFLEQEGLKAVLLPALEFMRIDKEHEPDQFYIAQNLRRVIEQTDDSVVYITQGFICRNYYGQISNLQRGGSDYTATIIGAAIQASEVQIWTDIDGFHNNDPREVEKTKAIGALSYDEAAELAYFGAKILHPQTVQPLREDRIPLRLKNTMEPDAPGTVITHRSEGEGIKAIAAKDGITALKIKSSKMLLAHGFLSKVFAIFQRYETSIDMITTSEIAVSLTIDDTTHLDAIQAELLQFAQVVVDKNQTIICLVGNEVNRHADTHKLFQVLQDVQVRMISYGGSDHNISLLVATEDKRSALELLQRYVFSLPVAN
ncbi:aspartate kinase [uncultured Dokdonia sp.]|uniref:aspartate kinase n=1 Tax=uncultured Dokdonia sp. TaxID=575653 RepID=UPI0030EDA434|tara:strand:- start:102345 stop:103670 length:1326 start_codon:yes stop_codon:yes gene_type:complete